MKRLFLYLAERAGHDWVTRVDRAKIDLDAGKRSLASPGVYVPPGTANNVLKQAGLKK